MTWTVVLLCIALLIFLALRARLGVHVWFMPDKYAVYVRWGVFSVRLLPVKVKKKKRKARGKKTETVTEKTPTQKAATFEMRALLKQFRLSGAKFFRKLRFEHLYCHIVAATGDAARTAVMFGSVHAGLALVSPFLNARVKKIDITVKADYELPAPQIYFSTALSIRTGTVIAFAISFFWPLLRERTHNERIKSDKR